MPSAERDLPPGPRAPGEARGFAAGRLEAWGCVEATDVVRLLVTELVTNAVLHAGTTVQVRLRLRGETLRIEVADGSRQVPVRRHYSTDATTGRGLALVSVLASDWGVAPDGEGKRVWCELDVREPLSVPDLPRRATSPRRQKGSDAARRPGLDGAVRDRWAV